MAAKRAKRANPVEVVQDIYQAPSNSALPGCATNCGPASTCPNCGSSSLATEHIEQECEYGATRYVAKFPVRVCRGCDLQFLDAECEERKHESLCLSQGLLTPAEIRQIGEAYGSLEEFAEKIGIPEEKLKQLEFGIKLQTRHEDNLIRLWRTSDLQGAV
jgi:YgiT-type zinc finger domain-containing protein